ncbi:hypothetical protein [Jannaschia seohaensis]|uniref:hypothetical protein n=1 Tax=Jannaschia seohaensis TaxID=475081 RepID=UPI001FE88421|nr:hypothetical protein [Jannaschia seohaensis]
MKQSLLAEFVFIDDPAATAEAGMPGPFWDVVFDFTLAADQGQMAVTHHDPGTPT